MGFLFTLLLSLSLQAKTLPVTDLPHAGGGGGGGAVDVTLSLSQPLISGNSVKIGYQIPYPGYIEFHLFNAAGEKIWLTAAVKEKGDNFQVLNRTKLESGADYTFEIWYKGKKYSGRFTNS